VGGGGWGMKLDEALELRVEYEYEYFSSNPVFKG